MIEKAQFQKQLTGAPTFDGRSQPADGVTAVLAAASNSGESGFKGTLDELAIYGRALSLAEVGAHFAAR